MSLRGSVSTVTLGPSRAKNVRDAVGYDKTWEIFVNVPKNELRDSAGVGRSKTVRKET